MKRAILFFFILITTFSSKANSDTDSLFELKVEIFNIGRDYVDCGVMNYVQCFEAKIIDKKHQALYGDTVRLYISCPEYLNYLPLVSNNIYFIEASLKKPLNFDDRTLVDCINNTNNSSYTTKIYVSLVSTNSNKSLFKPE